MTTELLFVLGIAFGSFLNVVALRYDPDKFLFSPKVLGGRSHCAACKRTLRWFELVPVVSFLFLRGRCRTCKERLSLIYPAGELISGILFAVIPIFVQKFYFAASPAAIAGLSVLWIAVFWFLLLISFIDLRLKMIPDEAEIALTIFGIAIALLSAAQFSQTAGSFMGSYAMLFEGRNSILINRLLGVGFGLVTFGILIATTRGKGMGLGDVKLAAVLGLLFGWPDIILICALGFVLGSLVGGWMLLRKTKKLKSTLAFGPFLALAALLVFFFGSDIVGGYFALFSLQ